ncbi:MAG: class I SAM-dependent methyltransferase [Spirosomataceae bacterium]
METYYGHEFYDQKGIFEKYVSISAWRGIPSEQLEKSVVLSLLPPHLTGTVLDLGCGYGELAQTLLQEGVKRYTGVDSSRKMIAFGNAVVKDQRAELIQADITKWTYPSETYDLVVACSVLHYIDDLNNVLAKIRESMTAGGTFIFSVDHPLLSYFLKPSSPLLNYQALETSGKWVTLNYFDQGPRVKMWSDALVVKYHRTIEAYWKSLTEAGFRVEALKEGSPASKADSEEQEQKPKGGFYPDMPMYLILKAVKM